MYSRARKSRSPRDQAVLRGRTFALSRFVLFTVTIAITPAHAGETSPAAGYYEIESYTMMPHLEEMRRIQKTEQRCIAGGDVTSLFPVMRQTAFRGCALLAGGADENEYTLRCQTDFVATGTAVLSHGPTGISGTLAVKMGGKNMTFSQHTSARPLGTCADNEPG